MLSGSLRIYGRPKLSDPILIEGLPGIGFVANIAALHLIRELNAKKFAEIRSSYFQDLAVTGEGGRVRFPVNELYYAHSKGLANDLIILYGNTQALTAYGQYELCGKILDISCNLGCNFVICMGGLGIAEKIVGVPKVYCTATDLETLNKALGFGVDVIRGNVFGVAGLLLGLAKLRNMHGLCLLAETLGLYPDADASKSVLEVLCKILELKIDLSRLEFAAETTRKILKSFRLLQRQREPVFPDFTAV